MQDGCTDRTQLHFNCGGVFYLFKIFIRDTPAVDLIGFAATQFQPNPLSDELIDVQSDELTLSCPAPTFYCFLGISEATQ